MNIIILTLSAFSMLLYGWHGIFYSNDSQPRVSWAVWLKIRKKLGKKLNQFEKN